MAKRRAYAWRPISEVYPDYIRQGRSLTSEPTVKAEVVPMAAPVTVTDVMATMAAQEPEVADVSRDDAQELVRQLEEMANYHNV